MRVLVTGLHGFTGHYAKSELEDAGHSVSGLRADLRDADSLVSEISEDPPEAVMHLAAQAFVGHANENEFYDINLVGTKNLLVALLQAAPDCRSVLLASSASVYGNQAEGMVSESALPAPANHYGVSKLAMEHMALLYSRELPLFITRPFNYTGVGQGDRFLIPKIVGHFQRREPVIELGNTEVFREFGDVRDVVRVYRALLEAPPVGDVLNVCNGAPRALNDVISICERLTGHSIEVQINPAFVRKNEVRVLAGDNSLLRKRVDDVPAPNLENTLAWMLASNA
jgi:nucleoside-diphosphate-sugar epimerase